MAAENVNLVTWAFNFNLTVLYLPSKDCDEKVYNTGIEFTTDKCTCLGAFSYDIASFPGEICNFKHMRCLTY